MPSVIDEHTQFIDPATSKPLVSGKVYIGTRNLTPKTNTITIYSDRDLTTAITNPQVLDSSGRTTNKIWVPGRYSIQVDDSTDVQKYQELDAGEESQTGITQLTNVTGTNTISADGTPTAVTSLVDGQQYNFKAANANTGAVTLQIDLTAAKAIKKLFDDDLESGDIQQNQVASVIYNSTADYFELVSNTSNATFSSLSTTSLTVDSKSVYGYPAQITDHIRAGNTQLWDMNGDNPSVYSFNVTTLVSEVTWESVGPTGSGADNIWTAMDVLPTEATVLIVDFELGFISPAANATSVLVNVQHGDIGSPNVTNAAQVAYRVFSHDTVGNNSIMSRAHIPLGPTNQDFQIYWNEGAADDNAQVIMYYRGFMTDD